MKIARTLADIATIRQGFRGQTRLGLVPTMGALHDGHLRLVGAARGDGARAVVSIFVNPLQFGDASDLARYPREEARDLELLRMAGCDVVWLPDLSVMYPPENSTLIEVGGPAEGFEGAHRPGHFRGVATVVAKLFGQVAPTDAYFGEKDWQQLQVVRRMTADLSLPVRVHGVPTVREADGLAMSSRNRFLSTAERDAAPALYRELSCMAASIGGGETVDRALAAGGQRLTGLGFALDYLALVAGDTLRELPLAAENGRLIVAARLGAVRLLDNIALR